MNTPRALVRFLVRSVLALLCVHLTATAQPMQNGAVTDTTRISSPAVPASRQAERVFVITMEGPIDAMTSISVRRRIAEAEAAGADAMVIDIDSPGGEVGAVLEICNAIKSSPIANSVGWINDEAYSGGAIVALACRRLISSSPASMGDALPILFDPFMGAQRVPEELRAKVYPPVIAELTDSARRYGYDEYLVQAIASDRIELWQIERIGAATPERYTIDANEYRQLFGAEPPRGKPMLGTIGASSTPGDRTALPNVAEDPATVGDADSAASNESEPGTGASVVPPGGTQTEDLLAPTEPGVEFRPASDELADVSSQISAGLTIASNRPMFDASQRGKWRLVAYISDGSGPIVVRDDQLNALGFEASIISDDAELRDYFGAVSITRLDESWSESSVRFLTSMPVRGVLIVLLLLGIFVEMINPGLIVPSGVALLAFVGLVVPPMLIGLAGWWEIVAILGGMGLIAFEVFITPGFGVFGIAGLVSLFAGLIGTFTPNAPGAIPGLENDNTLYGAVITLLAFVTAGIVVFFLARNLNSIPIFSRLVLNGTVSDSEGRRYGSKDAASTELLASAIGTEDAPVAVGDMGLAMTDLRPVGRAEFDNQTNMSTVVEVYADEGYLPRGTAVQVSGITRFRVTVSRRHDASADVPSESPNIDADTHASAEDGGTHDDRSNA